MRKKLVLTALGLAVAASFAPLTGASASCGPDLSVIGGPSCSNLCPRILNMNCVD